MDAHNLAVVFGPTLIRVPDNEDPITVQGQVNVFMKFIISEYYALVPDDEEQHTPENHVISADETDEKDDDTVEHTDDELGSEEGMPKFIFFINKAVNNGSAC